MNSSKTAFAATVVVAVFAIAIAIFAFWKIAQGEQGENELNEEQNNTYIPTDELLTEMQDNAERLITNNHTVLRLYITKGLPHLPEPYDNKPEDGIYIVDSDEYKTLADVDGIVDETFLPEEAERIKTNPGGLGQIYFDKDGQLGISDKFLPHTDYPVNWENTRYSVNPISDTECELKVTLMENGNEAVETRTMTKLNGAWYLDRLIY